MIWTTPTIEQVKMDAEIGSYQEDTEPVREAPIAHIAPIAHEAPRPEA
jgi:hypothetical protein